MPDIKKIDQNTLEITTTKITTEQVDVGKLLRDRQSLADRIAVELEELQRFDDQIALARQAGIDVAVAVDVAALPSFSKALGLQVGKIVTP